MDVEDATISSESAQNVIVPAIRNAIDEAIRKKFIGIEGTIRIHHLWSNDCVHRFRVNWWIGNSIRCSKFIVILEERDGLQIKEHN